MITDNKEYLEEMAEMDAKVDMLEEDVMHIGPIREYCDYLVSDHGKVQGKYKGRPLKTYFAKGVEKVRLKIEGRVYVYDVNKLVHAVFGYDRIEDEYELSDKEGLSEEYIRGLFSIKEPRDIGYNKPKNSFAKESRQQKGIHMGSVWNDRDKCWHSLGFLLVDDTPTHLRRKKKKDNIIWKDQYSNWLEGCLIWKGVSI